MPVTRGVGVALGALLIVHAVVAPVAATAVQPGTTASTSDSSLVVVDQEPLAQTTSVNTSNTSNATNTSARHLGPDLPRSDSAATVVLSELEARLASRLISSSEAVEIRQFDTAEAALRGNTSELLRQYQRVASESASPTDDETAQTLNLTVQQQRQLIEAARSARANYSEYQLARANGNETRARRLARNLLNSSAIGNETAAELERQYKQLANTTDINTTVPVTSLNSAQERLAELRQTVQRETFVTTTLSINATQTASPTQPLRVHGQLSANDTGLPDGRIELAVGDETVQVVTTANGTFTATLRPITVAPGNRTAVIRFIPAPTSQYEAVSLRREVRVAPVSPTVVIDEVSNRAQYNDTVVVSGYVSANRTPLPGVPVRATIGGQPIGTTRTNQTGDFHVRGRLPAAIPNGTQQVTVTVSQRNTSVQRRTQSRSLQIAPTPTSLTLTATQLNQTTISITGKLTTGTGAPLVDRPVELTLGTDTRVFVRSDETGRFNATVAIPAGVDPSALPFTAKHLTVTGQYAATGTNLKAAASTATIQYTPPLSQSLRRTGYAALAVMVLGGAVVAWRRRDADGEQPRSDESVSSRTDASSQSSVPSDVSPVEILERARVARDDARIDDAVQLSYIALRSDFVDEFDLSPASTHWELYRALEADLDPAAHDVLYTLTTAYERATYTEDADPLPHTDTETILNDVEQMLQ